MIRGKVPAPDRHPRESGDLPLILSSRRAPKLQQLKDGRTAAPMLGLARTMSRPKLEIPMNRRVKLKLLLVACAGGFAILSASAHSNQGRCANHNQDGMALFGDLHVHTAFSFDAAANSIGSSPADAYRYAKGEAIAFFPVSDEGVAQGEVSIDRPLDFLAVTDHGEFLGEQALCRTPGSPAYNTDFCQAYRSDERLGMTMLGMIITTDSPRRVAEVCGEDGSRCLEFAKSPWQQVQEAAEAANDPCRFTSFIGYEYTGTPYVSNYHRNVIFRGSHVPKLPVSYIDAPSDSQLWSRLDATCQAADGCDYLTIPHNTNLANGRMAPFRWLPDNSQAKQGYAETRLRREPIMEIFQHKGGSECINGLSSVLGAPDELCEIESVRRIGQVRLIDPLGLPGAPGSSNQPVPVMTEECQEGEVGEGGILGAGCVDETDFQRSALLVGLREAQRIGVNPIKLGVIASTDTHTATAGGVLESDWRGAVTGESNPEGRLEPGLLTSGIDGNPGGLAGVWAKENTRDAIFDAMLRREVFGTSGPRIRVRLFAGWNLSQNLCNERDMVSTAYRQAVPMGGDLIAGEGRLGFLAEALQDPRSSKLTDVQLIKGWVDKAGQLHSQVLTIARSESGDERLCTVYIDREFDASQSAYYYLRAVEAPTPRWHTYDCARLEESERPAVCTDGTYPEETREMAWSSPIWYRAPIN